MNAIRLVLALVVIALAFSQAACSFDLSLSASSQRTPPTPTPSAPVVSPRTTFVTEGWQTSPTFNFWTPDNAYPNFLTQGIPQSAGGGPGPAIAPCAGCSYDGSMAIQWTFFDFCSGSIYCGLCADCPTGGCGGCGPFMDYTPSGPGGNASITLPTTTFSFWLTMHERLSSGFACSSSHTKWYQLLGTYPAFTPGCISGSNVGGVFDIQINGVKDLAGDAQGVPTGFSVGDGAWHCYEVNIVYNHPGTADGAIYLYRDGVLGASTVGRQFTWNAGEAWCLDPNNGGVCNPLARFSIVRLYRERGVGTRWTDNVSLTDTRVGCGAAPPPPTTPNAPSNFQLTRRLLDGLGLVTAPWRS